MKTRSPFVLAILAHAKAQGVTNAELARRTGIRRTDLVRSFRAGRDPRVSTIELCAAALGMHLFPRHDQKSTARKCLQDNDLRVRTEDFLENRDK